MRHENPRSKSTIWLTPPQIIDALGGPDSFDLDPCAAPAPRPFPTARVMNSRDDGDGLLMEWHGRVWLNPPYDADIISRWMRRIAEHDEGTALIFARTETAMFQREVWQRASGLLFVAGRLTFHRPDGTRATMNAGAPSVLCAYGQEDLDRLAEANIDGAFVPLRFARFALVEGIERTWATIMRDWLAKQDGPVSIAEAYRYFSTHPKARRNPNWQAKVRQQIAAVADRVGPATYQPRLI